MRMVGRRAAIAAIATAALMTGQAMAAPNCWRADEISAAKIRDLQTMLMVAALRCHGSGVDVLADYNRFVTGNRPQLMAANGLLKAHFVRVQGGSAGQRGYDSFATALANTYGAGGAGRESCADMGELARIGGEAGASLLALAEQRGLDPIGEQAERCAETIAAR